MLKRELIFLLFIVLVDCLLAQNASSSSAGRSDDEAAAAAHLRVLEAKIADSCFRLASASWQHATNINKENELYEMEQSLAHSKLVKEVAQSASVFNWRNFKNEDLRRQFKYYAALGTAALPEQKLQQFTEITTSMSSIYDTAKICSFNQENCELRLTPDLDKIMRRSRNESELRHTWVEWRNSSGKKIRKLFENYVELMNEAARLNNFSDAGAMWLDDYESPTFKEDIEQLWQTLKPLYQQLHAYVRGRLARFYGNDIVDDSAPIPAHLLGNMWAQSWDNIYDLTEPFSGKKALDVTPKMVEKGLTPLEMFRISEEFFTSLGLKPMPKEFWNGTIMERIPGREMNCHASAWDFCNGVDFRIKQCTVVTMEDLIVVHHEMGHIQYDIQYKHLPYAYRNGANPGFHEAIGDVLALSVRTPQHLQQIGLLDDAETADDYETTINYLFSVALSKIAFLPFAYIVDKWRWDIFQGSVNSSNYNEQWWKLREEYQGVRPPVERTEEDFDAGAKYHVAANVEYLRYFVSSVIQFQFHRSLCIAAGQYDPSDSSRPLHNCDIYRSKDAGEKLAAMLSMGSSKPWPEAMRVATGQDKMDASAIREYFKPLEDWLVRKNKEENNNIGWTSSLQAAK